MNYDTICIDFDGTIAKYDGFKGIGIFGDPIKGVKEALLDLKSAGKKIIIYTTRGEVNTVAEYLRVWHIPFDFINETPCNSANMSKAKPIADVYIDDRAIQFKGEWTAEFVQEIINFKPWHALQKSELNAALSSISKINSGSTPPQKRDVPELMEEAIKTYRKKNQDYGDSYKIIGHVMEKIFPKGITLNNASEFNRIGALILILTKITRYANLFSKEKINFDSKNDTVMDLGVYSFILSYLEEEDKR